MCVADPVKIFALVGVALVVLMSGCDERGESDEVMVGMRVNSVLGGVTPDGYLFADGSHQFRFPNDHGAHPGYRSEWWYLTAVLKDSEGEEYGMQFTLFRQALAPRPTGDGPWHAAEAYLGHLAITDVERGMHIEAQRLTRGHPQLAGAGTVPKFRAYIEDWSIEADGAGAFLLSAHDIDQQIAVQLRLTQEQPIVLQGNRGLSRKSAGSGSYYYSLPRLHAAGHLELGARSVKVAGLGWFDREWSTSVLSEQQAGWEWFALQLDDGRSVMAYRFRRRDGRRDEFDHGSIVRPVAASSADVLTTDHAAVTELHSGSFALQPLRYWADERGVNWPVQWRLTIGAEELIVDAMLDDQVMDTSVVYWEGIVAVRAPSGKSVGRGFMELTGYEEQGEDSGG